jgi:6-phosphofructokinase 1
MEAEEKQLSFVTLEGLLAYGEALSRRTATEGVSLPPPPPSAPDRLERAKEAVAYVRAFVDSAQAGFPDAEAYRTGRRRLIEKGCRGDELIFYAAWNRVLAEGGLSPLYRVPITTVQKPVGRRPVAIVPRAHLTPQLAEGRIVLDLGDDRFWL